MGTTSIGMDGVRDINLPPCSSTVYRRVGCIADPSAPRYYQLPYEMPTTKGVQANRQAVFFPTRCWLLCHSPLAMYQRCNVSDTVRRYYRLIAATSGHCICCQWRRSRPGNVWSFCRRSSPLGRLVESRDGGGPAVPE